VSVLIYIGSVLLTK